MRFVNLTSDTLHLGPGRCIQPTEPPARCVEITQPAGCLNGVPIIERSYGGVTGLPAPADETLYIVSQFVRLACPDRLDLASPGDAVHDGAGQLLGYANLIVNAG